MKPRTYEVEQISVHDAIDKMAERGFSGDVVRSIVKNRSSLEGDICSLATDCVLGWTEERGWYIRTTIG